MRLGNSICAQVPERVYLTKQLPKTATGKIQRRHMVDAFVKKGGEAQKGAANSGERQQKGKAPLSKL